MTTITAENGRWIVETPGGNGQRQRYVCASEEMARRMARAFERSAGGTAAPSRR